MKQKYRLVFQRFHIIENICVLLSPNESAVYLRLTVYTKVYEK